MAIPNRRGGLLRIAHQIEGRGVVGQVPSSGMGEAVASAARHLDQLGGRIGQMADQAAAIEGEEAGRLAGLDPEFRPTKSQTIRGLAYDKAGLQVAETRTRSAMLAEMEAAFDEHGQNPEALAAALEEKRRAYVDGAPPELRPDLAVSHQGAALRLNREARRAVIARVAAERAAAAQEEATEGLKRAHQIAFGSGLDEQATLALAQQRDVYARTLARVDTTGKPLFSPEQKRRFLEQWDESVTTSRVLGAYDRLPGLAAKQKFIEDFEADFAAARGFAATFDLSGFQAISSTLRNGLTRERSAASVAARAIGEEIKAVEMELKAGTPVPIEQMTAIEGRIAAHAGALPELLRDARDARTLLTLQSAVRLQPPEAAEAMAAEISRQIAAEGVTPERSAARIFLEGFAAKARSELKQDALGWAARVGLVPVAPLDFSSAETAGATMRARIAQRDEVARAYGVEANYMQPDERRALATAAAQGGEQMLAITSAVAAAAGDRAPSVIAEFAQDAPVVAFVAGHVNLAGPTAAARDAADGIALTKTEGYKGRAPSKDKARAAAEPVLGRALSELPEAEQAALAMANAIYEVRAQRHGAVEFDPELWAQGLSEALGARQVGGVSYGGIAYQEASGAGAVLWPDWSSPSRLPVVLPPSVRSDGLPDLMQAIRTEDLAQRPRFADGSTVTVADVRRAKLKSAGTGRYWLALGDPEGDDPQWLLDEQGRKYVLDLEALLPALGQRRPDLVLGGR